VEGEVSNLRAPGSGHLYFTLKDAASQMAAVLFRVPASQLRFSLEDGMKVVARGRISLYEAARNLPADLSVAGAGGSGIAAAGLRAAQTEAGGRRPLRGRPQATHSRAPRSASG
jgi:exodeoxyribonuclease VII large subunit